MKAVVAVLPGDGIGPEVVAQGVRVLRQVASAFGHSFELREALFGGCAIDQARVPLPPETLSLCKEADAVLLGAVGGRSGIRPRSRGPKKACSACAASWGSTPTCARWLRSPRWRTPRR